MTIDETISDMWDILIERGIATEEELKLITNAKGCSLDTLDEVLYCRTGYRDIEQMDNLE